ncbi:VOC family protein [Nonomuraea sp. K274]|uniref:VOC family protein n=1 Tax=Nonomuraea cypriaca TaxID=1187855 RepID=A0A931AJY5_9ACTN|nr:VOC family protein [Nonomuraea cypriaca]MBF8191883.1 VOC family protein [Nonomuraea cypriaca]
MTISISQVNIYVEDQQRAVDFWTGKMGFTITTDMPYGEDRWIDVEPPGGGTRLVIHKAAPDWPAPGLVKDGKPNYVMFQADDIVKAHAELAARGVRFTQEPTQQPWGWSAVFSDDDGNLFHLGQGESPAT